MKYFNYKIINILLFSFLVIFSIYTFYGTRSRNPKFINKGDILVENKYFNSLSNEALNPSIKYTIFVYLGKICGSCIDGLLVHKLESIQSQMNDIKIKILLPYDYNQNDLENIKHNHSFNIDFENISKEFQDVIDKAKEKENMYPYSGFSFIVNNNGFVMYSDYLFSRKISLKKKVDDLLKTIKI